VNWLVVIIVIALGGAAANAQAQSAPELARSVMSEAIYVREAQDQAWRVRIVGTLPRGPGLFIIVWNEAGEVIHAGEVPFGTHTAEQPFVIELPADGAAQQYVIKLVGQQDNHTGLFMPITDLPFEVYGGTGFAIGYARKPGQVRKVALRVPADAAEVLFSGHGDFRIAAEDGSLVKDTKTDGIPVGDERRYFKSGSELPVTLDPQKTYWIEPYALMYLGAREPVYFAFDVKRWFGPKLTWSIQTTRWWEGVGR